MLQYDIDDMDLLIDEVALMTLLMDELMWSELTVKNWHRFRGSIFYDYTSGLLALWLLENFLLHNDPYIDDVAEDTHVVEVFEWWLLLHHAMMLSWVSYDKIMDDTYILLDPHSFYDATDHIYDDRRFFWWSIWYMCYVAYMLVLINPRR